MLMSHLQESIQFADVETQLLYNRTLVQLGLCAFRHGNIRVAHDALLDIQSSGRKKELLAQVLHCLFRLLLHMRSCGVIRPVSCLPTYSHI